MSRKHGEPSQRTKDHVYPRHMGGRGRAPGNVNIVWCYRRCNERKHGLHPRDWYWEIPEHRRNAYLEILFMLFPNDIEKIKIDLKVKGT